MYFLCAPMFLLIWLRIQKELIVTIPGIFFSKNLKYKN
jgi:hypothetical protein